MSSAPISQDQWDHMLEAWRIFDTDGDGLVTSADLQTVLLSFGYEHSIEVRLPPPPPPPPHQSKLSGLCPGGERREEKLGEGTWLR